MKYLVGLTIFILSAGPSTATPSLKNRRFFLAQQGPAQCILNAAFLPECAAIVARHNRHSVLNGAKIRNRLARSAARSGDVKRQRVAFVNGPLSFRSRYMRPLHIGFQLHPNAPQVATVPRVSTPQRHPLAMEKRCQHTYGNNADPSEQASRSGLRPNPQSHSS